MATKSLGTLTLDLVAKTAGFVDGMTKAERQSKKTAKEIKASTIAIGVAIGNLAADAARSLAAFAVETVNAANEINRLAYVSGASGREFQKYSTAAKIVGIEQEKLADIFKDTSDKVGDFLTTGGGALKDFFEQIAPKIGVTAEQFRNLSGPQALELYASSLEEANVSQSEMTFYMEAIASDATALVPLLKNSGEGFRVLGEEAERAGAILGDDVLSSADELAAANFLLDQRMQGLRNTIASAMLPVLADFVGSMEDASDESVQMSAVSDDLADAFRGIAASAVGSVASIKLLANGIQGIFKIRQAAFKDTPWWQQILPPTAAYSIYKNWDGVKTALDAVGGDLDQTAQEYATILNKIWNAGAGGESSDRIKELADLFRRLREQRKGTFQAATPDELKDAEKLQDAIQSTTEKYQEQLYVLKNTSEAHANLTEAEKLRFEIASGKLVGINAESQKRLEILAQEVDELESAKKAQEDYNDLIKDLQTDQEELNTQLLERFKILDQIKTISEQERKAASDKIAKAAFETAPDFKGLSPEIGGVYSEFKNLEDAQKELETWYTNQLDLLKKYREEKSELNSIWDERERELTAKHQQELAQIEQARQLVSLATAEDFFGNLAGLAKTYAGESSDAYKVLFAAEKAAAIARSIIAIQTALAQASASAPFPANLAAMATVAAQTASIIATIASTTISGQAHDGLMSVPKTGTYILEKGERVVSAETTAKMDKQLDNMRGGNIRIVNAYDDSHLENYLGSDSGERVIMNHIRRNARTIRSLSA